MGFLTSLLARFSNRVLRLPRPRISQDVEAEQPISRVLVFGKFPNPTFDYYFAARLAAEGMPTFELIDIRTFEDTIEAKDAFVIIVRYASFALTRWIIKNRATLAGVVVFVDDDIPAAITSSQASLRYRYRLLRHCILPLRALDRQIDELWVSTEILRRRLSRSSPLLIGPAPVIEELLPTLTGVPKNSGPLVIAYHATAIHVEEHHFLLPVIKAVLKARPSVRFEVVATGKSAGVWSALEDERVVIRRPKPWGDYLRSQPAEIDVMLVPVAPSHLNECRAETKRIDIARMRAAALLSDCSSFQPAEDGEILLPYEQAAWTDALIALIDNRDIRHLAALATKNRVQKLVELGKLGLEPIKRRANFPRSN